MKRRILCLLMAMSANCLAVMSQEVLPDKMPKEAVQGRATLSVPMVTFESGIAGVAADDETDVTERADTTDFPLAATGAACGLAERIDALLSLPMFETSQVGLMVYDLTADSVVYVHNHRQLMRPASTMKLVTAITALDQLGATHGLQTRLCYQGTLEGRTLRGNLYCVGSLDPMLGADDLRAMVDSLHSQGIDTIRGGVYLDNTMKDSNLKGEGWCWDDDDPVLRPLLFGGKDRFSERFAQRLRDGGVVFAGAIEQGKAPGGCRNVCVRSHSVGQLLPQMMKESDNLYAEALFYQVGAATGQRPATAKTAASCVRRLISQVGLSPGDYKIADGSGLSLYNYITPELLVRLLHHAWQRDAIFGPLYGSVPIAGKDGTLAKRMRGTKAQGNVHAKTGTVTAVSCLAGYLTEPGGHVLCFAIMNNGLIKISRGREFQDRVCRLLCGE